jgi:hypothetical protein
MLWLVAAALAQEPGLAEERLAVERAATAVAEARARGASRAEIAELMAVYRDTAERLAAREAAEAPAVDLTVERLSALRALTDALAAGREAPDARRALVAWLGEPSARMSLLEQALDATRTVGSRDLERALVADVLDQANALFVLLTYDAATVRRDIDRSRVRVSALRRDVPGQAAPIDVQVDTVRLEGEIEALERTAATLTNARDRCDAIRVRATTLREKP